jgi:hypothetical protein
MANMKVEGVVWNVAIIPKELTATNVQVDTTVREGSIGMKRTFASVGFQCIFHK